MSFSLQVSATSYVGNASTSTAYPVTFPVVSTEHIAVAVESPAGAAAVSLTAAQFTISSTGGGYEIRTATAWPATARVTVFRSVPFDQPFDFQDGGAILPSQIEQGFDRVVMQVQQLWRQVTGGVGGSILPGSAGSVNSVAVFANPAAQLALKPAYIGQWGVRLSDYSAWVGKSLTTGDWTQYNPPQVFDVWSPDSLFSLQDTVVTGSRWLGTLPIRFLPEQGMRISANVNAGMSVQLSLTIGQSNTPLLDTSVVWNYSAGVDSIVIPFSAFTSAVRSTGMPGGARVDVNVTSVTGPYGFSLKGLSIDFLGRWLP